MAAGCNLERAQVPERYWVEVAITRLRGEALHWWELQRYSYDGGNRIPRDWFENSFDEFFVPMASIRDFEDQFRELKQGTRSVDAFIADYNRLS